MREEVESPTRAFFSLITLQARPRAAAMCAEVASDSLAASGAGEPVGCWISEIGRLNEVTILRRFDDRATLASHGAQLRAQRESLGCDAALVSVVQEDLLAPEGLPCTIAGELGPVFELRRYVLKAGGLSPSLAAWRAAVPLRAEVSPLALILHPEGPQEALVQVWPYRSLDDRQRIRSLAVSQGVWPPQGSLQWIDAAQSSIVVPTAFSPLKWTVQSALG